MEKLVHDKASIHYTISGNKLPTLLFVHGASINLTYWDAQVEYFHNRYTVIAIDLPEHGKSGRNQTHWSIEAMGKSVADFIKDLALEQVIMVGHSMGGNVNLVAATTYSDPILGFIGVDNFKNAGQPLAEEYQQQSKEIIQNLHHNFSDTNESYARMVLLTPQTPEAVTDRVVRGYRQAY